MINFIYNFSWISLFKKFVDKKNCFKRKRKNGMQVNTVGKLSLALIVLQLKIF